ncbi:hypothetical protein HMPREF1549_02915 [Actinomyces johnsonii F0510]|uniref:Uncharacterized protein n=1 Tax=Actinomyces johnsonii F0510 TaxID=1227262 RepID=U1PH87_9ACTO|nr:hypothetical protein HMPREF1549_02915 [Actinomyces johnsonii F0510]
MGSTAPGRVVSVSCNGLSSMLGSASAQSCDVGPGRDSAFYQDSYGLVPGNGR